MFVDSLYRPGIAQLGEQGAIGLRQTKLFVGGLFVAVSQEKAVKGLQENRS